MRRSAGRTPSRRAGLYAGGSNWETVALVGNRPLLALVLALTCLGCEPPLDPDPPPGASWPPPRFVVTAEGEGPANERPLDPLPVGALYAQTGEVVEGRLGGGWASRRVLRERDGFVLVHRATGIHYGGGDGRGGPGGHASLSLIHISEPTRPY